MKPIENPITGQYKFEQHHFNSPKRLSMEPKKKFNWDTIWKIIHRIITAILAAETTIRTL